MSYGVNKFDKYKEFINEDSILIGRLTGVVFIVKYLMENNLKVINI